MSEKPIDGLVDRAFRPLPLGTISPRGWLERQLHLQADGLTGHIDEIWPDLADNQWLGGSNGGWERAPYYVDGLVPLAYLLDNDELKEKVETWIVRGFLEGQDETGWIGPVEPATWQGYEYDLWPRFIVLKTFTQYYEATGDERVIEAITEFLKYLRTALSRTSLSDWGKYRWAELVLSIHWLYERTGESWLLELAETAIDQGYNWSNHFADFSYSHIQVGEDSMEPHGVSNAMGLKSPGVRFRHSVESADRNAVWEGIDVLDRFHGQASGTFSACERLAGPSPSTGTELCVIVEYMFSLEYLASLLGDSTVGDRLERLAYNALPALFSPDMWAHQHTTQVNQVNCSIARQNWSNGPEANVFGLNPNFGCCTANMHQGWPKFASHLWMRADDGLASVAYAPCEVTVTVNGERITVVEETEYPFEDTISLHIDVDAPVSFPLKLRIPNWTIEPTIEYPDGTNELAEPGTYHEVEREWSGNETIELTLSTSFETERRYRGAVTLRRGPLVFALRIGEEWKSINEKDPHGDWEVFPTTLWNYGLELDTDEPATTIETNYRQPGTVPFSHDEPPIELTTTGRLVPEWHLDREWSSAEDIPLSPTRSRESSESVVLIPYGCTNLRVTEFPLLADQPEDDTDE